MNISDIRIFSRVVCTRYSGNVYGTNTQQSAVLLFTTKLAHPQCSNHRWLSDHPGGYTAKAGPELSGHPNVYIQNNPAKSFLVVGDGYLDLSETDMTDIWNFPGVGCNLVTGNVHNGTSLLCNKGLGIRDTGMPELEGIRFLLVTLFFITYLREGSRGEDIDCEEGLLLHE